MSIQLYHCHKLKANISLEACAANRAKPDMRTVKDAKSIVKPHACIACEDWKTLGVPLMTSNEPENTQQANSPKDMLGAYNTYFENAPYLLDVFASLADARDKKLFSAHSLQEAMLILTENLGELAKAILADSDHARHVALQVAAVSLLILEETTLQGENKEI